MARFARVVVPGVPYHVTHRGNLRSDVFFCDAGRQAYLNLLELCCERFELDIWAYCLMTNHLQDGEPPVVVPVEFLAPKDVKLHKNRPKLLEGFRILQTESCVTAFHDNVRALLSAIRHSSRSYLACECF